MLPASADALGEMTRMRDLRESELALRELLTRAHPGAGWRDGHHAAAAEPDRCGFRRPLRWKAATKTSTSRGPTWCSRFTANTSKPARTSSRPNLWQHTLRSRRVWPRPTPRNQLWRGETGPASCRRILKVRKAALRGRLDGSNNESDQRHRRRHIRRLHELPMTSSRGLIEGGADLLLLETCQDTRNIKAGILAIQDLADEIGAPIPLMISVTIEAMGTMLAGQAIEALWASLDHANCSPRHELRHWPGVHDRSHPHVAVAHRPIRLLLSERRTAQRRRPLSARLRQR